MAIHGRFDLSGFFSFIPIKNRCPNHFRNACSAGIESRFGPGICHRCPSLPSCSAQGIPSSGRADQPSQQYLLLFPSANRNALPVGFGIRFRFAGTAYGHGIVFLLLLALWQYYRQEGSAAYAWLVPLIFISTPTFFSVASSAYVDLQAAAYVFLAFYSWENGCTRKQAGWFFLMALFTGAAVATKLTTVVILPLALLGLAVHGRSHKNTRQVVGQCLVLVLSSLMLLLPWLARNYFFTGNPFAPFFMTFFGGENGMNWDIERSQQQFQYYSSFGMGHGIQDFLLLPINLTFFSEPHSLKFDGQIGILYLLLLPALLGLRRKSLPLVTVFFTLLILKLILSNQSWIQ